MPGALMLALVAAATPHSYIESPAQDIATIDTGAEALPGFNHLQLDEDSAAKNDNRISGLLFDGQCDYMTLTGHGKIGQTTLEGRCRDDKGYLWDSGINLNECIGNYGGQLYYTQFGDFDQKCRPCVITEPENGDGLLLKCNCHNRDDLPQYTTLVMGETANHPLAIRASNGRIICGDQLGYQAPHFSL